MPLENEVVAPATAAESVTPEKVETTTTAPVTNTEIPKPSLDDTLRAKFRELEGKAPETTETQEVVKTTEKTEVAKTDDKGRTRDPVTGQFVKTAAEEAAEAAAAVTKTPEELAAEKAAADAKKVAVAPEIEKAPTTWKKEAAAKYAALDPEIKAEIHRRESDIHKGIEGYREKAQLFDTFDKEFRPYEAMIRGAGTTPQDLTKAWLNVEYKLHTGTPEQKAALFVETAEKYGITQDLVTAVYQRIADGGQAVEPSDPRVLELEKTVNELKGALENQKTEVTQREFNAVKDEWTSFAQKNPHAETVREDMRALVSAGRANTFQEAYDKAIWANPEVRAILQAEQQAEKDTAAQAKAAEKAAAAKRASATNVTVRGTLPAKAVVGTMDDTLRAKLKEMQGS